MSNIVYKVDGARFSIRYFVRNGIQHISIEDIVRSLAYAESTIQRPNRRFKHEIDNGQVIKQQIVGSKKLEYWITLQGLNSFLGRSRKPKAIKQAFKEWIEHVVGLRYEQQEADINQLISDTIDKAFATNEAASTTTNAKPKAKSKQVKKRRDMSQKIQAAAEMAKADELNLKAAIHNNECYYVYFDAWCEWHSKWLKTNKENRLDNYYDSWEDYYDESNIYWKEYAKWLWLYDQNPDLIAIDKQKFKEFEEYGKSSIGSRKYKIYWKHHHIELVKHNARLVIGHLKFLERMDRMFR